MGEKPVDPLNRRGRERLARGVVAPRTAVGLLAAAILAVGAGPMGLLVVGPLVLPWWMLSGALLILSFALLSAQAAARPAVPVEEAFRWSHRQRLGLWFCFSVTAPLCGLGMALDASVSTGYVIVTPESSGGCRLVARETTFLRAGSGTMYLAEPSGLAYRISGWNTDEGDRPVRAGMVEVDWSGSTVRYSVSGTTWVPEAHTARCWTEAIRDRIAGE